MFNSMAERRRVFAHLQTVPDDLLSRMHEEWLRYKLNMPNDLQTDKQLKAIEAEIERRKSDH